MNFDQMSEYKNSALTVTCFVGFPEGCKKNSTFLDSAKCQLSQPIKGLENPTCAAFPATTNDTGTSLGPLAKSETYAVKHRSREIWVTFSLRAVR